MSVALPFQIAPAAPEGGISIDRIKLLSAMSEEISRQYPELAFEPRLFNALVNASNAIADEFAKPLVKATPGMGLEAWLDSDDTGSSSLYMAWCLSSGQFGDWHGRKQPEPAYPHDPDDLGRCIRLIRAVPELADRVDLMFEHGHHWQMVANNWHDWMNLYDENDVETLYAEMKAVYGEE